VVNVGIFYGHLEYFMAIWKILWPSGLIFGRLVYLVIICYIFPNLVCLDQDKSGNPGPKLCRLRVSSLCADRTTEPGPV
jgi:hypothetical protein